MAICRISFFKAIEPQFIGEAKFDEAAQACDEATRLDPELIPAWMGKGSAFFKLNKTDEAIKAFDKVISLDPNNVLLHGLLKAVLSSRSVTQQKPKQPLHAK